MDGLALWRWRSAGIATVTVKAGTYTQATASPLTISANVLAITFRNINLVNTATGSYAAATIRGSRNAFYGCQFVSASSLGISANLGVALIADSYIEALDTVIYGYPDIYLYNTTIVPVDSSALLVYNKGATDNSVLYNSTVVFDSCSVQPQSGATNKNSRSSSTAAGGYVFDTCYVTYTSSYGATYGETYLGRPYSEYSIAVYMNSYLDKHISSAGWEEWSASEPNTEHVTFGEYNNSGPGAWSSGRVSFATSLTATEAASYTLSAWIGDTSWLDLTAYDYPVELDCDGHLGAPDQRHCAPDGRAVLVSVAGSVNGSYSHLTDALASLPDDSSTQTIFLYAGSYDEQPRSQLRGQRGFTLTFSRGLSVSPVPTGHSDAETATFSTASNQIALYNINIINTANLDGAESSYVTLAGSIYGSEIGFYGCSLTGWQDTLLTGSTTGYQYHESSYIEGAIDFIWGYSKAYFKGCTIGAKRQKSAITAQSRASASAVGGYIFDQCLFEAAPDATVDLTELVYLGRPYSEYALVVVKNSYLTDIINPSGWKVWSTSDPRTDYVMVSTDWIDLTYWDSIVTPEPSSTTTTTTTTTTTASNSTTVYDGTSPPTGAYVVSKTAIANVTTYDTIQSALDALPTSSKVTPTVFIYPGTYEEQLVVNRSGTTVFMGYSNNSLDYASNQVTIQYNHGVDTQADESNSDSATVYATGNYFQAININFVNNYGTTKDYASLGFAVKSSKYASLYGCQVTGNQDALLINGYFFASNSYIEGNIDMIWGSGAGYFLNSTISPNEDDINLTADKRTTNTTAAGFVFDQQHVQDLPDRTSTVLVTLTQDIGATVTLAESFKTTVEKSTVSTTTTITEPTVPKLKTTVLTLSDLATITPAPTTKTTTVKDDTTTTVTATVTKAEATTTTTTTTVKSTVTATSTVTSTPKASTITTTVKSTTTSLKTSTPGTVKVTSYTTVTAGTGGTTTISTKATTTTTISTKATTTTTVDVTSTKTTTKTTTTTLSCIPAAKKRALLRPRAAATVTEYTTLTTVVRTSTAKIASPTVYITATTTKTVGETTTLQASTSTITSVSRTTKEATETIPAVTLSLTETSTETVAKTTTLKPSTVTDTITSLATKTATVTEQGETSTVTSLKTTTIKTTVSLPKSTVTVTKSTVTTLKETTTLATPTSTILKTSTVTLKPSVTITSRATSTKTKTVDVTTTETSTVTKTSKSAKACAT
ncbi:pectin lyase-like protein [Aspergillus ellipticus CBS 707.79]|uniref:pectinesterase n=1 Tax=Aspergillus ellipticus CBS 707.79 TaxID=1448320 RepID=A0A319ETA5_9EURO|nr:pectin lyase-like protein [Aspergillus ellipticus CBS 707.79]